MSHFTTVKTQINDLDCLEKSLLKLDFQVIHDARIRGWQGRLKKTSLVARFQEKKNCAYDIGFVENEKSNTFDMVADWWAIQLHTGKKEKSLANEITQHYAYHKVLKEIKQQGFMVAEENVEQDQSIRLVVRKW